MNNPEYSPTPEARPAQEHDTPDWRRLDVTYERFSEPITDGIAMALEIGPEIDANTARCIAHVLGRAHGRHSALAHYGRTGEGHYIPIRDEYLTLYHDPQVSPITKELIDWLGTYLIERENIGSGRRFMNEHLPPKLEQLLVRTSVPIGDERYPVNIPATWHSGDEDALIELLTDLRLPEDPALQTFLSLPDVSAGVGNIMESFHEAFAGTYANEEAALRGLSPLEDWETGLAEWCIDNGLEYEALDWNYEPLMTRLRDIYDIVERNEMLHVFIK